MTRNTRLVLAIWLLDIHKAWGCDKTYWPYFERYKTVEELVE